MAAPAVKEDGKRFINILVLGESGVGKSTFINAFVNYMTYQSLKEAEAADKITCLIPCKFTVTEEDENGKLQERTISVGDDKNEMLAVGEAATQGTKSYAFPIGFGATFVRIIDTPGMGDRRGVDKDNENFENILTYLSTFDEIHGICMLLKPDIPRRNALFEFCIKQLLSRLEKSACNNMIFVFTNSRSTFFKAGETLPILRAILNEIKSKPPYCDIPVHANNVFSMDNEAFRYLVQVKNSVQFTNKQKKDFADSWDQSSKICWDLISYISGDASRSPLKPHKIRDTVSINEARRVIIQLSQPLAEIAQLILDNLNILKRHKQNMKNNMDKLDELKKKLYMPVMNLQVIEFEQPRTVCTSANCCTFYQVEEKKKCHYSQLCHNPCYLRNVPKEIVGSPELVNCYAIDHNTKKCRECSCDFSAHMHIYYETRTFSDKIIDKNVHTQITNEESVLREVKKHIEKINKRRDEYEEEKEFIIKSTAKFAHFLQNNAITPYNDAYEAYIDYLIDRECSMGPDADKDMINHLKNLLQRYKQEKDTLNRAFDLTKNTENVSAITADDIFDCVQALYSLKHTGDKICELFNKQTNARKYENDKNTEYVHPHVFKKRNTKPKNKKKNKSNEGSKENDHKRNKSLDRHQRSGSFSSVTENSEGYKTDNSQEARDKNKNFNKNNNRGKYPSRGHNFPGKQNFPGRQNDVGQGISNNFSRSQRFATNSPQNFQQRPQNNFPHNNWQKFPQNCPNNPQSFTNQPNNWPPQNPNLNQNAFPQNHPNNCTPFANQPNNWPQQNPNLNQNAFPQNHPNNQPQNFQSNWPQENPTVPNNFPPSNIQNNNLQPGPRNYFPQNHLQTSQNFPFAPTQTTAANNSNQRNDQIEQLKKMVKVLNVALEEATGTSAYPNKNIGNQNTPNANQNFGNAASDGNNTNPFNYQGQNWQNQQFPHEAAFGNSPQCSTHTQESRPQNRFGQGNMNRGQHFKNFGNRRGGKRNFERNNFRDGLKPDNTQNIPIQHNRHQDAHGNFKTYEKRNFKPQKSTRHFEQNFKSRVEAKEKSLKDEIADLFSSSSNSSSDDECSSAEDAKETLQKTVKQEIEKVQEEQNKNKGYMKKLMSFLRDNKN